MTKPLRVGLIGYGFMGRTHSNAYRKVTNFFDVPYEPVLKVVCGLEEDQARAFAEKWGYESYTTDWREVVEDDSVDVRPDIDVPGEYTDTAVTAVYSQVRSGDRLVAAGDG